MDTSSTATAWYLCANDEFEGPYLWSDLIERVESIPAGQSCTVWNESLGAWTSIDDFPELTTGVRAPSESSRKLMAPPQAVWPSEPALAALANQNFIEDVEPPPLDETGAEVTTSRLGVLGLIVGLALVLGTHAWYRAQHPIAKLPDLSREDYARLEAAAAARLDEVGPRVEVALSTVDPEHPVFRVATNLADAGELHISVRGKPETLVNRFTFERAGNVKLTDRLGRTEALRMPKNEAIPAGRYDVEVSNRGSVLARREFFLGGSPDASYRRALASYHRTLRETARAELNEITQMAQTLEGQLNQLTTFFESSSRPRANPQTTAAFHEDWRRFGAQIAASLEAWTFKENAELYFYAPLYARLKPIWSEIDALEQAEMARSDTAAQLLAGLRIKLADLNLTLTRLTSGAKADREFPVRF